MTGSRETFYIVGIVLLDTLLCICSVRDLVYFARTIEFKQDGCAISIWKFKKTYRWCDLTVQLCDDSDFAFRDSDKRGPGMMIRPKSANYGRKLAGMTYCRIMHPFSSVYLRFESAKDEHRTITGKIVYYGYNITKEDALKYFRFAADFDG